MALWEPSLLMSIINVRLTSDVVKPKANIYNDLRTFTGSTASQGIERLNCIAGDQDGAGNAWSRDNERYRDVMPTIRTACPSQPLAGAGIRLADLAYFAAGPISCWSSPSTVPSMSDATVGQV